MVIAVTVIFGTERLWGWRIAVPFGRLNDETMLTVTRSLAVFLNVA